MIKNKCGVILSLVLILGIGVFTAGCGNTQAAGGANDPNSLTIAVVSKDTYLDTAVKKFEELHPGVRVEVKEYTSSTSERGEGVRAAEFGDIEKYVMAMNTQLMSGQGSDIILLNNLPYQTYADKNLCSQRLHAADNSASGPAHRG